MEAYKPCQLNGTNIIYDDDNQLTSLQIQALLLKIFKSSNIVKKENQFLLKKRKIALIVKNLSWLNIDKNNGDPRLEKKRIQIPKYANEYIKNNIENGYTTYFLGIYSNESEKDYLYCLFEANSYFENKANNSSAHLNIIDLVSAKTRGQFFKLDKNENRIFIFNQTNFYDFLINDYSNVARIAEEEYQLLQYLKKFWKDIPEELKGDECYQMMFNEAYSKTFECEWAGFYQEFLFEKHLKIHPTTLIGMHGDKKKDGIDLDLKINITENFYADLKADNEIYNIRGNKKETIDKIIAENGHIWYIVAAFNDVVMDKVMEYHVMNEYNRLKEIYNDGKPNSKKKKINMDYADKMKYSAKFNHFYVLDINSGNIKYLLDDTQGKNSDGSKRTLKYTISKKKLDEFKIFEFKR